MNIQLTLRTLLGAALLYVAVTGCTTETGQQKEWLKQKEMVEQYKAEFPSFTTAIQARFDEAQAMFDEAKAKADKDERVDGMKLANDHLAGLMSHFKTYQAKRDEVKRLKADKDIQQGQFAQVKLVMDNADAAIKKAEMLLKESKAQTAGQVKQVLKDALLALEGARNQLQTHKDAVVARRKAEDEARRAQASPTMGTGATAPTGTGTPASTTAPKTAPKPTTTR